MLNDLFYRLKQQLQQSLKYIPSNNTNTIQYLTLSTTLPESIFLLPVDFCPNFYLSRPDSRIILLGLESLLNIQAQGKNRFKHINKQFLSLKQHWLKDDSHNSPIASIIFSFDEHDPMQGCWHGLPNTELTIPKLLIKQCDNVQTIIINIQIIDTEHHEQYLLHIKSLLQQLLNFSTLQSSHNTFEKKHSNSLLDKNKNHSSQWLQLSHHAIELIKNKYFDKLVASRSKQFHFDQPINIPHLIENLSQYYSCCTIMAIHQSGKTLVSASPEQFLSLHDHQLQSNAIGGTIARTHNKHTEKLLKQLTEYTHQNDQQHSNESKKLLKEHQFISQSIYQCLDPLCHSLQMPISPFLMKLHNLYHLETPISGKLMEQYNAFDCIEALHPTPAVSGLPRPQAKQWLIDNESYARGWYTGSFGWIDGKMNANLSVILRCALIEQQQQQTDITLFAGAGLVAESESQAEWQETELKMQTIIEMLLT